MARRATITWPKDVYRKKVATLLAARGAPYFLKVFEAMWAGDMEAWNRCGRRASRLPWNTSVAHFK